MIDYNFKLNQTNALNKLITMQKEIVDISIALGKIYPIAIVKDNVFYVFDFDEDKGIYEYKCEFKSPMSIDEDVFAAFILEFYNNKVSAVINQNALDTLEGYIFVFHEFVHCYQLENGEVELKSTVKLAEKSISEKNFMWEITYEFPYENKTFIKMTTDYEEFYENNDLDNIKNYYKQLKDSLDEFSYEYMIWQQWKEGYARYIENLIRERFKHNKNYKRIKPPYNRGIFYEIGCRYIELLVKNDKYLLNDIKGLYFKMISGFEQS